MNKRKKERKYFVQCLKIIIIFTANSDDNR